MGRLTRRALLAGALAATSVSAAGPAQGRAVGWDSGVSGAPAHRRHRQDQLRLAAATVVTGSFSSPAMKGAQVGWSVCYPPGTTEESVLPVVLALHGGFGNHLQVFDGMGFLLALSAPGLATDVAVASVDAGASYYHRRADGTDTGAMIVQDLLPMLRARGLDTSRLALTGCSMGGYGAVLLAATVLRGQVAAVAPISAAFWPSFAAAPSYAFDSAEDFSEHDVFAARTALATVPLSVACGLSDPFFNDNQDFVAGFATPPATSFTPGTHDNAYWVSAAATQLVFLSRYLTSAGSSTGDGAQA